MNLTTVSFSFITVCLLEPIIIKMQFILARPVPISGGCQSLPVWCVALVLFEVGVDAHLLDSGLSFELDVDEVRLGTVRLPVALQRVVSQLINSKAW